MKDQILNTYDELDARLQELPEEIAVHQETLTAARQALSADKAELDAMEAQLRMQCDGKNAEQRQAQLVQLKAENHGYRNRQRGVEQNQRYVEKLQDELDHLTRLYGAVTYRARLLAGLMSYLAGAQSMPVGKGQDDVSAEILETLGL